MPKETFTIVLGIILFSVICFQMTGNAIFFHTVPEGKKKHVYIQLYLIYFAN